MSTHQRTSKNKSLYSNQSLTVVGALGVIILVSVVYLREITQETASLQESSILSPQASPSPTPETRLLFRTKLLPFSFGYSFDYTPDVKDETVYLYQGKFTQEVPPNHILIRKSSISAREFSELQDVPPQTTGKLSSNEFAPVLKLQNLSLDSGEAVEYLQDVPASAAAQFEEATGLRQFNQAALVSLSDGTIYEIINTADLDATRAKQATEFAQVLSSFQLRDDTLFPDQE